jgi:hypothetical protein
MSIDRTPRSEQRERSKAQVPKSELDRLGLNHLIGKSVWS